MRLFVNKKINKDGKVSYYSTISNEYNGRKTIYYLTISFKKDIELDESGVIEVKNFFFSCYPSGNTSKLKIIFTDYEKKEDEKSAFQEYNYEKEEFADFGNIEISDDQIAF